MASTREFAEFARGQIEQSIAAKQAMLADAPLMAALEAAARATVAALAAGGKVLLFGNGGSAADAQHIACELVGRFKRERRGLAALALTVNTSAITAIANDLGFQHVFARQVEALGRSGDVAVGISTSGNAQNVLLGVEAARAAGLITVGLTGGNGGKLKDAVQYCLRIPSAETARIQECHILLGHIWCDFIESDLASGAR